MNNEVEQLPPPEIKATEVPPEVENAARVFASGMKVFKHKVDTYSKNELKRLLKLVIEYPLQDDTQFVSVKEHQRLEMALLLMEAKTTMIAYSVEQKQKEMEKLSEKSQDGINHTA